MLVTGRYSFSNFTANPSPARPLIETKSTPLN